MRSLYERRQNVSKKIIKLTHNYEPFTPTPVLYFLIFNSKNSFIDFYEIKIFEKIEISNF